MRLLHLTAKLGPIITEAAQQVAAAMDEQEAAGHDQEETFQAGCNVCSHCSACEDVVESRTACCQRISTVVTLMSPSALHPCSIAPGVMLCHQPLSGMKVVALFGGVFEAACLYAFKPCWDVQHQYNC